MRKPLIAGNWKMFTTSGSARQLAGDVVKALGSELTVDVALCPPFPYLSLVEEILRGTQVQLGAQNLYPEKDGAFTGEVSPAMLVDVGCDYVILGHSERRHKLGETDNLVNRKVQIALAFDLKIILCLGETLEELEANRTETVLERQLTSGLAGVSAAGFASIVLAYEPVWAIGTGRNASPDQAQMAHAFLRDRVNGLYDREAADHVIIQYGGSVKPDNAFSLLSQPDVDGALVGGASLQIDHFLRIVRECLRLS